jgi:magnesium-transporting ATPase (P-type)
MLGYHNSYSTHVPVGPLTSILDGPNGCFMRWMLTAAITLITLIFVWLSRRGMQQIADRGGVRLTSTESSTRTFLLVLMFVMTACIALSLYKALDCYL